MKRFLTVLLILTVIFSLTLSTVTAFAFVPPGLQKKGGLPPGLQKKGGLPPGIQKKFMNMEQGETEVYDTVIEDIDLEEKRIVIKEGTAILHLLVSDTAEITLDGVSSRFEDLQKNDKAILTLDEQNTVIKIEATKGDDRTETEIEIEGKIVAINKNSEQITILQDNVTKTYQLAEDAEIIIDEDEEDIDDLKVNMEVKATIKDNKIIELEVTTEEYTNVEGVIKSINYRNKELVIENDDDVVLYKANTSTKVYVDGDRERFSDLRVGMEIEAYVSDLTIITIYAETLPISEFTAVVKSINTVRREVVLLYGDEEKLFKVNSDAVIKIDGVTRPLSAIREDMEVEVKVQDGKIIEIIVEDEVVTFEGRLIAKSTGDEPSLVLEIDDKYKIFEVKRGLDLSDITVGKQVIIYVKDNLVFAIRER